MDTNVVPKDPNQKQNTKRQQTNERLTNKPSVYIKCKGLWTIHSTKLNKMLYNKYTYLLCYTYSTIILLWTVTMCRGFSDGWKIKTEIDALHSRKNYDFPEFWEWDFVRYHRIRRIVYIEMIWYKNNRKQRTEGARVFFNIHHLPNWCWWCLLFAYFVVSSQYETQTFW